MPLALATRQSHHWQSSLQPSPWHSNKLKIYSQWPGQYFKLKRQLTWFKNFENSWDSSSLVASPSAGTGSTTSDTGSLFFKVFVKCPWTEQETVSSFHWISENCFKHDSAHSIGKKMQTSCAPMDVLMLYKANPSRFRTWPRASLMISLSSNSVDSWLQK